jgi:hypothetical protein
MAAIWYGRWLGVFTERGTRLGQDFSKISAVLDNQLLGTSSVNVTIYIGWECWAHAVGGMVDSFPHAVTTEADMLSGTARGLFHIGPPRKAKRCSGPPIAIRLRTTRFPQAAGLVPTEPSGLPGRGNGDGSI